jgi:DNA-binding CsgD family transcriptional regulator
MGFHGTGQLSCGCQSDAGHLTRREIDVLLLVAADQRNSEIATTLGIGVRTVDQHLINMRQKATARSREGLVARSYAAGILLCSWPPRWSGRCCLSPVQNMCEIDPRSQG